jgi:CPA2 family monovalent cation:H+ antiporter-2
VTPILATVGNRVARRLETRTENARADADDTPTPDAIILGFGRQGRMVAEMLVTHGQSYIAVDSDIDLVGKARRDGYNTRFGDVSRPDTLDRLGLDRARALIITMDEPVLALRIARRARAQAPDLPIIARARDTNHAAELYKAGASDAVPETLESSLQLAETALIDLGLAMGPIIASVHEKRDELQQKIKKAAQLDRMPRLRRYRVDEAEEG